MTGNIAAPLFVFGLRTKFPRDQFLMILFGAEWRASCFNVPLGVRETIDFKGISSAGPLTDILNLENGAS